MTTAMNLNWNSRLSSLVETELAVLRSDRTVPDEMKKTASITNALPVYSDLSGSLCVNTEGKVLYYDSESQQAKEVTDGKWCIIAAVAAAEKYTGFSEMLPMRPVEAKSCSYCSGIGRQAHGNVLCGKCSGLGWIV